MIKRILNFQFSIFNFKISGREILKHPLFSGSFVMIVGSNFANFIAYIYHLVVGRMLGPPAYGKLAAIISIISLFTVSFTFLGLVIVKYVSSASKKDIRIFFSWLEKKAFFASLTILVVGFLVTDPLSKFLKLEYIEFLLFSPIIVLYFLGTIYNSFLQGSLKFGKLVIATNVNLLGRLLIGILLILVGYSVFGAVLGIFISSLVGLFVAREFLGEIKNGANGKNFEEVKTLFKYSIPVFVISLANNSLYSSDLVLVKHFFTNENAGMYAALSTLGKIIFFGTAPISAVMFPLVSQRHSRGEGYKKIFLLSSILTAAISFLVLLIYWQLPNLTLKILFGEGYIAASPYLVWFGIFITLFTFSSLIVNFYLSIGSTKVSYLVVAAALAQVIGIWYFHKDIFQVITISIICVSILLTSLLIYLGYESKKGR